MESRSYLTPEKWQQLVGADARCIIEAGSHDGSDTAKLLEAFPKAIIHCWEPDERPRIRFHRRLPDHPRVILRHEAISDKIGTTPWFASHGEMQDSVILDELPEEMQRDWDASGSIMRPTGHDGYPFWLTFQQEPDVPTISLDSWLGQQENVDCVDLLWADIQGAELKMIAGAQRLLEITRYAYLEVHDPTIVNLGPSPAQLYEGQPTFKKLAEALPGWMPLGLYGTDSVLFRNEKSDSCVFEESQAGESPILRALLPDDPVIYVDVGVGDYANWNVTWPFYKKGGHGLLVEPRSDVWPDYFRHRPRDVLSPFGAHYRRASGILRLAGNASSLREDWAIDGLQTGTMKIRLEPLCIILADYPEIRDNCQLCSIDTEGHEQAVLQGIDWKTFRPDIFIIEYRRYDQHKLGEDMSSTWHNFVLNKGYHECCRSWLNIIYLREDLWPRWQAVRDSVPPPHQTLEQTQEYNAAKYGAP